MISTQFGDFSYGDPAGLAVFLANHDQSHRDNLQALAAGYGISLTYVPLSSMTSDAADWFGTHHLLHVASDKAWQVPATGDLSRPWRNEQEFNDWHQIHNQAHEAYNRAASAI
jgi:hypothetical protein